MSATPTSTSTSSNSDSRENSTNRRATTTTKGTATATATATAATKMPQLMEPLDETLKTYATQIAAVRARLDAQDSTVDDLIIYRFLKGWNFDENKSVAMLNSKIAWRAEHKMDAVREVAIKMTQTQFPSADKFMKVFPHTIYHRTDKKGQPLSIERIGMSNPDLLARTMKMSEIMAYHKHHMENKDYITAKISHEKNTIIRTCKIIDLSGLGTKHLNRSGMKIFKQLISMSQDMYPEMLGTLYIVNCPWVFNMAWKIIKPWLNEGTLNKIHIVGNNYKETLLANIEKENLPEFLGGTCTCSETGGCVIVSDPDEGFTSVDIGSRGKHELKVELKEAERIVSWEFRTRKNDIGFSVEFAGADGKRTVVQESKRYDSDKQVVEGAYTSKESGTLYLIWDNSFSRFTGKTLLYMIENKSLAELEQTVEEDMVLSPGREEEQ